MAELAELVLLIGISLILIVKVVFRPTTVEITHSRIAVSPSLSRKKLPEMSHRPQDVPERLGSRRRV